MATDDPKKTKEQAEATNELTDATNKKTEADKKNEEQLKKLLELQAKQKAEEEARIDRLKLLTALEGDAAANAGNLKEAYEKLQEATAGYKEASEALNNEQGILADMYQELQSATGDRKKQLEEDIKLAEQQVKNREQEIKDFEEITKSLREQTKEYRLLSEVQKKQQPMLESFFSTLTVGSLEAGMAQKNFAFKLGDGIKQMKNSANAGLQMKLAFQQVVNVQNIAAFTLNTVVSATKAMAAAFDQAQAKFTAVTGVAKEYNGVLIDVQKQGNRFGITAAEGGEAMASLLAGFNDFHRSAPGVQKDLALGVAGLNKLGVSTQESASLFNNLNKILGQSGKQALATSKQLGMMGTKIGISTSKMLKDYNDSLKTLAVYGDKSIEVFTGIAAAAKAAGVETATLLGLADKFDTFSGAAETTGKLNAILGSQLSATEMLTMSENERIKTLITSVQATGQAFGSMDKFTQKAIANAAGITDMAEANRIFGMSMSEYESYEDQMKAATNTQQKFEDTLKAVTPVLDKFKLLAAEMAAKFAPALEIVGDMVQGLLDAYTSLDDKLDGGLGTILGVVSGVALLAAGLGGLIQTLKTMKTLVYDNIVGAGKWVATKLGLIETTAAETMAENANSAAKTTNTATENMNSAAKTGNTAKTVADTTAKGANTAAENLNSAAKAGSTVKTAADTTAKNLNTAATKASTTATRTNTGAMGKAIPVMLALGAAVLMIGGGIYLAATGLANFVEAFSNLTGPQLIAASVGLVIFTVAFGLLIAALIGLVAGPQAALTGAAVGVLLAIGGAVALIGLGVGIAAAGFSLLLGAIAIPTVEQYLAFGASMIMFGAGLYVAAAGMLIFAPLFTGFMAGLMLLAVNPIAWMAVSLLGAVAASVFMIGLGAKMAMDSMANLISTIASSEGLGDIIGGLFGSVKDVGVSASVEKRVQIVRQLIGDVSEAGIKSELENLALITTGVSAGLMTENTVSNLVVVSSLADTIKNIFNPEITIEMDSGAVEKLFKEGVYKVSRST